MVLPYLLQRTFHRSATVSGRNHFGSSIRGAIYPSAQTSCDISDPGVRPADPPSSICLVAAATLHAQAPPSPEAACALLDLRLTIPTSRSIQAPSARSAGVSFTLRPFRRVHSSPAPRFWHQSLAHRKSHTVMTHVRNQVVSNESLHPRSNRNQQVCISPPKAKCKDFTRFTNAARPGHRSAGTASSTSQIPSISRSSRRGRPLDGIAPAYFSTLSKIKALPPASPSHPGLCSTASAIEIEQNLIRSRTSKLQRKRRNGIHPSAAKSPPCPLLSPAEIAHLRNSGHIASVECTSTKALILPLHSRPPAPATGKRISSPHKRRLSAPERDDCPAFRETESKLPRILVWMRHQCSAVTNVWPKRPQIFFTTPKRQRKPIRPHHQQQRSPKSVPATYTPPSAIIFSTDTTGNANSGFPSSASPQHRNPEVQHLYQPILRNHNVCRA